MQWHFGVVARNHFALHDGHGLLRGFGGIEDERVGVFAGAQCAVEFVAAVGEGFRTNASQDSADVVFNALGHKQVWRCEQFLLLQQQGACGLPVNLPKANLADALKLALQYQRELAEKGLSPHGFQPRC